MTQSGYRVSRLQQSSRTKWKKRMAAIPAIVAVLALGVASLFIFGVIHFPSFGSSRENRELSFLTGPASNQAINASSINILVLAYKDRDPSQPITSRIQLARTAGRLCRRHDRGFRRAVPGAGGGQALRSDITPRPQCQGGPRCDTLLIRTREEDDNSG